MLYFYTSVLSSVHPFFNRFCLLLLFFFFNDTATTEIYTLSLHDALPICDRRHERLGSAADEQLPVAQEPHLERRSEEHTSELQSRPHLVCRLLLEKKKDMYLTFIHRVLRDRALYILNKQKRR